MFGNNVNSSLLGNVGGNGQMPNVNMNDPLGSAGQGLSNSGLPFFSALGNGLSSVGQALGDGKHKGAPKQPSQIPQATTGFFQPMNGDARSQLLQAMMQRSRGGATMPTQTGA